MGHCVGTTLSIGSVVVWNSSAQEVMPRTFKAWKECISFNTCMNGASDESISIYTKNRCQWSGFYFFIFYGNKVWMMKLCPFKATKALGIVEVAKAWRLGNLPKRNVSWWFSSTIDLKGHVTLQKVLWRRGFLSHPLLFYYE